METKSKRKAIIISGLRMNIIAVLGIIPISLIYGLPFYIIWKNKYTLEYLKESLSHFTPISLFIEFIFIFIIIIIGAIIHELLHGFSWSLFAKKSWKSIHFGFLWQMMTPYCHCSEPLTLKQYIIGAVMPGIILGQLPALISLITGDIYLLIFGLFFTLSAIGDFIIIYKLRNEKSNTMVLDHETEAGCWVYK